MKLSKNMELALLNMKQYGDYQSVTREWTKRWKPRGHVAPNIRDVTMCALERRGLVKIDGRTATLTEKKD